MTRRDLDLVHIRQLLTDRLAEVERLELMEHEAARPVELDQQSVGRLSRMDALQMQAMAAEHERRFKAEHHRIIAALQRLEAGEYGYCLSCEAKIPAKRLELDPSVTLCVKCAEAAGHH
ncbi:MAG TPA: TraR/DksA C4-type zinc finger protein [Candidatus Omnitrophota bacterium]|nr:TraR/DksA C4-type zinc finger protein [Candidatus Omnitrophota bacterium]